MKELGADPALYEKVPTADLEEEKPGIADEVALGVTYNEIDDYLEGKQVSPEAQATIEKWLRGLLGLLVYLRDNHQFHCK